MPKIVETQVDLARTGPPIPVWFRPAAYAAFGIGLLLLVIQIIQPTHHRPHVVNAGAPASSTSPSSSATSPTATVTPTQPSATTTKVPTTAGSDVGVDPAAYAIAQQSFRAIFDPALFNTLPIADGVNIDPPAQAYPTATVSAVDVSTISDDGTRIVWVAHVDADGTGPLPPTYATRTTTRTASGWVVSAAG